MSSTKTALQNNPGVRLAFVLAIEGKDLAFCTEDASGLTTAWAATEWSNFKTGLHIIGTQESAIELFDSKIQPDALTFLVTDADDDLLGSFFKEADETADVTYLDGNIGPDDTTIGVAATDDFASSGTIYIGHEEITYSSKNDSTDEFTVSQRGKRSLFGTSSDAAHIGRTHVMRAAEEAGVSTAPQVRSTPRTWYNRIVALYAHHKESDGTWSTKSDAFLVWAGKIQSYEDHGDGNVSISCLSVLDMLRNNVFHGQLKGRIQEGFDFDEDIVVRVIASNWSGAGFTGYVVEQSITATDERTTWHELLRLFAEAIDTINQNASVTSANHKWAVALTQSNDGPRVAFFNNATSGTFPTRDIDFQVSFFFDDAAQNAPLVDLHHMLGYDQRVSLERDSTTQWSSVAREAPVSHRQPGRSGRRVFFTVEQGAWMNQPAAALPPGASSDTTGLLRIGSEVFAIATVNGADTQKNAIITGWLNPVTKQITTDLRGILPDVDDIVRVGDAADRPPTVAQVWMEKGTAGGLLLKLMLSTGTSAYNHATYDVYDSGLGIAIPATLVNIDSFLDLDDISYELQLTEPLPFADLLQSVLAASNYHAVFDDGELSLTSPGQGSPYTTGLAELTESNKATPNERTRVRYSANGLINRITLEYSYDFSGRATQKEVVVAAASYSDFGQQRAVRIEGRGILDGGAWREHVAAPAIAYFSRPLAIAERSIDRSQIGISPGDAVLVTDNAIVDPRTGTRGVTNMPAWVLSKTFDWRTMSGFVELAFLGEVDWERMGLWSPSAQVNTSSTTMGSPTTALVCHANRFSLVGLGQKDADEFVAGDKVRIVEISPSNTASPSEFYRTVDTVSSNTINITASVTLTTGKEYVVEADDAGTVVTTQLNHAFLCDNAGAIAGSSEKPYLWNAGSRGSPNPSTRGDLTVDYTQEFAFLDDQYNDSGEPLSVRKLFHVAQSANNLFGVKTSRVLVNEFFITRTQSTGISTIPGFTLAYGPVLLPYYHTAEGGTVTRDLDVVLYVKVSAGVGTFTVRASPAMVELVPDISIELYKYVNGTEAVTNTSSSTSAVYLQMPTLTPPVVPGRPPYFWLHVEAEPDSPVRTAHLLGIHARVKDANE